MTDRRRLALLAAWGVWLLVTVVSVLAVVAVTGSVRATLRADASVVGTFAEPGDRCPDEVEYVVDGETYRMDVGRNWCGRLGGGSTQPQRVYYDSEDPSVAVFADPGGTTPTLVLDVVVIVLLISLVVWLQWFWWWRQRPWWSGRA